MTAVDQRTLDQIALSWEEYRFACERLDRYSLPPVQHPSGRADTF